jgi:mercuric ion binding protein
MKKLNLRSILSSFFAILLIAVLITGCGEKETGEVSGDTKKQSTTAATEKTESSDISETEHINVKLSSMQCGMCKKTIETAVKNIDGIKSINVDKNEKVAHVDYDKSKVDLAKIEVTITAAGYNANDKKADPKAYSELDDCCKLPEDQKDKK